MTEKNKGFPKLGTLQCYLLKGDFWEWTQVGHAKFEMPIKLKCTIKYLVNHPHILFLATVLDVI